MRWIIIILGHLVPLSFVRADGLVYQLPSDGAFARFEVTQIATLLDITDKVTGVCTISSVGKEFVDDTPCRWIEFQTELRLRKRADTVVVKALIPERHLGEGKAPLDHLIKGWVKATNQREAVAVKKLGRNRSPAMRLAGILHPQPTRAMDITVLSQA